MPVRVPVAALVLVVGLTVGVVVVATFSRLAGSPPTAARVPDVGARAESGPLGVLHHWDEHRAAAWAAGDAAALARLYTADSTAGAADVALLRRYADRGLRVRAIRMQVLRARTLTARPRLIELEVTDRLATAVAVRPGDSLVSRRLPTDRATTHRLVLRLVGGQWRVARVSVVRSGSPGRP